MIDIGLICKGILIGIAKIMPGISGSLLAVSLGIYDQAIEAINHPFKNVKYNLIFLGNVGIGVLFSITVCSYIIIYFINRYFFFTILLFVGFIMGTLSEITKEIKYCGKKEILSVILLTMILLFISLGRSTDLFVYENNLTKNFMVLIFGFIDAATMVIPGISGTAIFLSLGCYQFVLNLFTSISMNLFSNFIPIFCFVIGLLVGVLITAKLMGYFLHYHKQKTYLCILSFALSSILLLLLDVFSVKQSILSYFIGIFFFYIGYKISKFLNT